MRGGWEERRDGDHKTAQWVGERIGAASEGAAPVRISFGALAAAPPSNPIEAGTVTRKNSQMDELCGVTGMRPIDAHATFPAETGSCIAPGSPVRTAFEVAVGRPDVSIGELDSAIEWGDPGDMSRLRGQVR
jgi:hypothetical protein